MKVLFCALAVCAFIDFGSADAQQAPPQQQSAQQLPQQQAEPNAVQEAPPVMPSQQPSAKEAGIAEAADQSVAAIPPPMSSQTHQNDVYRACLKATVAAAAHYYCKQISYYLAPTTANQFTAGSEALVRPSSNPAALASVIALDSIKAQVASSVKFEAQRLDKQVGGPVSSDASTNLVSKPGATQLLSFAVESGALTQTQNGNAITIQGNLDQLSRFLIGAQETLEYTTKGTPVIQNITVSSSLTTNAPSTASIPVSGSATSAAIATTSATTPTTATKLSSIGARYQFHNKYDPKSAQFQTAYTQALANTVGGIQVASEAAGGLTKVFGTVDDCANVAAPTDTLSNVISTFDTCVDNFIASGETANKLQLSDLAVAAAAVTKIVAANIQTYKQALATAAGVPFTFEYTYNRPENQPDTHDFRGIVARNVGAGILNLNVAGSIYGFDRPANAGYGRFKDIQFAGEFDRSFSSGSSNSPAWSIAAYSQWQADPSVLTLTSSSVPPDIMLPTNAQSFIMGTKGWLAVVQGKVIFKIGGAQIPVAAKWSNKTDLLDKGSFGGQFGISYDLSQIKQLIGLGGS